MEQKLRFSSCLATELQVQFSAIYGSMFYCNEEDEISISMTLSENKRKKTVWKMLIDFSQKMQFTDWNDVSSSSISSRQGVLEPNRI